MEYSQGANFSSRLSPGAKREQLLEVSDSPLQRELADTFSMLNFGHWYCGFVNLFYSADRHVVELHKGIGAFVSSDFRTSVRSSTEPDIFQEAACN